MPRIQGLAESGIKSADALLKSGKGYVFSVTIGFRGVTAGELCTLKDGLTDAASDEVAFFFPTANGVIHLEWAQGKEFETGIFFNKGPTAGDVYAAVTFK